MYKTVEVESRVLETHTNTFVTMLVHCEQCREPFIVHCCEPTSTPCPWCGHDPQLVTGNNSTPTNEVTYEATGLE